MSCTNAVHIIIAECEARIMSELDIHCKLSNKMSLVVISGLDVLYMYINFVCTRHKLYKMDRLLTPSMIVC